MIKFLYFALFPFTLLYSCSLVLTSRHFHVACSNLLVLGNKLLKLPLVGSHHLIDLLAPLVVLERGHGLNTTMSGDRISSVHIDAGKLHIRVGVRKLVEDGPNESAGSAPVSTVCE